MATSRGGAKAAKGNLTERRNGKRWQLHEEAQPCTGRRDARSYPRHVVRSCPRTRLRPKPLARQAPPQGSGGARPASGRKRRRRAPFQPSLGSTHARRAQYSDTVTTHPQTSFFPGSQAAHYTGGNAHASTLLARYAGHLLPHGQVKRKTASRKNTPPPHPSMAN